MIGPNESLTIVVGVFFAYKWGKPALDKMMAKNAVSGTYQIFLAKRFLAGLDSGQILQVEVWLQYGTGTDTLIHTLGVARFIVLKERIAPTLRYNKNLFVEALADKI